MKTTLSRAEMPLPREIVLTVRVDEGMTGRQLMCHLVVIDDDDIDIARSSGGQRLVTGGAAIDGDDQLGAIVDQLIDRRRIGAVSFEDAIGNIDGRPDAEMAEKTVHQRRGGRAVDIVVAEDRDALAALDGTHQADRGLFAIGQLMGIGHQAADRRIEEFDRLVYRHAAPGQHPGDQVRQSMDLRHSQRAVLPCLVEPRHPAIVERGFLHTEKRALYRIDEICHATLR